MPYKDKEELKVKNKKNKVIYTKCSKYVIIYKDVI